MKEISLEDLNSVSSVIPSKNNKNFIVSRDFSGISTEQLQKEFETPIEKQKELAAQLNAYISQKLEIEYQEDQRISDHTRRFMELYSDLLDKIHKNIYGEKSTNLHLHKITHADISKKIREAKKVN